LIISCAARAQSISSPNLTLSVSETGNISARVKAVFPPIEQKPNIQGTQPQGNSPLPDQTRLWIIALPFALEPGKRIVSADDVHVAQLSSGKGFTLLALTKPLTLSETTIEIGEIPFLTETPDGKAKLEIDSSFPNMSQSDRQLLNSHSALKDFDIDIVLPKKYDEADVNQHPQFSKIDNTKYFLPASQIKQGQDPLVWISFPNPVQRSLEIAKLLATLVIGLFTLAIQYPLLKGKNTWWFIGVFILSLAVLGFITYYGVGLTKRLEFLISVAVIIPNAVYGLLASIYLILAKKFQATVTGQIRVNNGPGKYASVKLLHRQNGDVTSVKETDELKEDGRYYFYIWGKKTAQRYQVAAKYNSIDLRSGEFDVIRGGKVDVPPLDFQIAVMGGAALRQNADSLGA
jgi:hypothetical protein